MGIRQREGTAGYRSLVISPQAVSRFGFMQGSMKTSTGTVLVGYTTENEKTHFRINLPPHTEAVFRFDGTEYVLAQGLNEFWI